MFSQQNSKTARMTSKEFLFVACLALEIIVSFAQDVPQNYIIGRLSDNLAPVSECNTNIDGKTSRIDLNSGFTKGVYLQSQNYPSPYGAYLDCTWIIYGNQIVVKVFDFSLEAREVGWASSCGDYVKIGGVTFCGKELKPQRQLRYTYSLTVKFHTDKRSVANGFKFHVFDEQPPTTKPTTTTVQTTEATTIVETTTSSLTFPTRNSETTMSRTSTSFANTSAASATLSPLPGTTVYSARKMPSEQGRQGESYSLPLNQLLVIIISCTLMAATSIFTRISAHYRSVWMQEVADSPYSQELTQLDRQNSTGNTINQISALQYETAMMKNEIYSTVTADNNNIQFDGNALAADTSNHKHVMIENDMYNATKDENGTGTKLDDSMVKNDIYNGVSNEVIEDGEERQDNVEKEPKDAMIENDIYDSEMKNGFDANDRVGVTPAWSSNFCAGGQNEANYEETEESLYETVD